MNHIISNVGFFIFCIGMIDFAIYAGFTNLTFPLVMIPIASIGMAVAVSYILFDSDNKSKANKK